MRWSYLISRYVDSYCQTMGKSPETINTYRYVLELFSSYVEEAKRITDPEEVRVMDIFDYLDHLKNDRGNALSTVHKNAGVIRNFYRYLVSLGICSENSNPARNLGKFKRGVKRVRDTLSINETKRLINSPKENTILAVRDKALRLLIYASGIRASECAGLK